MDKAYWENYYINRKEAPTEPSSFARYVVDYVLREDARVVELGCGNGRDAEFLGENGLQVVAYDQAEEEIRLLNSLNTNDTVEYRSGDFTNLDPVRNEYDAVYSRFTLHSVSAQEQHRTLEWAKRALKIGGYLCIEVRGQKNGLYGLGEVVNEQPDAYIYEDHYRRFLDKSLLDEQISNIGLDIILSSEEKGFAPFNNSDDYFIRHISQKS